SSQSISSPGRCPGLKFANASGVNWNCESSGPSNLSCLRGRFLHAAVFLHQIHRFVRQLEQMRMRAVTVSQDGESEFAIAIPEQERRVTGHAPAVSKVTITVAHFGPPRQSEPGSFISPNSFNATLKLIVLAGKHLLERCLADQSFFFEDAAVEIGDEPVRLIEHRAINQSRRPD